MKALFILTIALAAGGLAARPQRIDPTIRSGAVVPPRENVLVIPAQKRNEIQAGRVTYSGFAVDLVKDKNPLHTINPFTTDKQPLDDNVARDINGKAMGWKLLTIKF